MTHSEENKQIGEIQIHYRRQRGTICEEGVKNVALEGGDSTYVRLCDN